MKTPGNPTKLWISAIASCCLIGLAFPGLSGAQQPGKKEILKQARLSYYNLRDAGLVGFQCSLAPNWDSLLADQRKANPAGADQAIEMLKKLEFNVSLAADDSVKVTHNTIPAVNDEAAAGLDKIYGGMEQMISGVFDTWTPFVLKSPFPEVESDYQLEDQGSQYRLSYKDGTADIVTTMGKDFAISNLEVTTSQFTSSIRPQFAKTDKGFLLDGYDADYRSGSSTDETHLKIRINYQQVDGLPVMQSLNVEGTYGGSPFQVETSFTGCQVTKR